MSDALQDRDIIDDGNGYSVADLWARARGPRNRVPLPAAWAHLAGQPLVGVPVRPSRAVGSLPGDQLPAGVDRAITTKVLLGREPQGERQCDLVMLTAQALGPKACGLTVEALLARWEPVARRQKLVFARTWAAIEVWARPRGLGFCDVVHVLADPRRGLRGRTIEPGDLVHLAGASGHPLFAEALDLLPPGVSLPPAIEAAS